MKRANFFTIQDHVTVEKWKNFYVTELHTVDTMIDHQKS